MITTKATADPLKALRRLLESLSDEALVTSWETNELRLRAEARRSFEAMTPMAQASAKSTPEDLASARLIVAEDEALAELANIAGALATTTRVRIRMVLGVPGTDPRDDQQRREIAQLIGERTVTALRLLHHCEHPDPVAARRLAETALAPVLHWTTDSRLVYGQTHQLKTWCNALERAICALRPPPTE